MQVLPIDWIEGTFSEIFAVITQIVGIIIISKYPKLKERNLLLIGLTWICFGYIFHAIVLRFVLFVSIGILLTDQQAFLIINPFLPIPLIFWLIAMFDLLSVRKKNKRILFIIYGILIIIFEILLFYFLIVDWRIIGEFTAILTVEWMPFAKIAFSVFLGSISISGILFAINGLRSDKIETRFKAKMLTLAFLSFFIYGVLDIMFPINIFVIFLSRFLLLCSSIYFYFGFITPNRIKKWLKTKDKL